jgi:hypothetical protein
VPPVKATGSLHVDVDVVVDGDGDGDAFSHGTHGADQASFAQVRLA